MFKGVDRRVHYDAADQPGSYGIVTAADAGYAQELELFYESLRRHHRIPLCIWDLGLPAQLLKRLEQDPLVCFRRLAPEFQISFQDHWQAWWKPLFIQGCPYDHILWVDVDCVFIDTILPLFGLLTVCPVLTAELRNPESARNPAVLYDRLGLSPSLRSLNSGVVGLRRGRDDQLLNRWLELVQQAASDPELAALIAWWDQGALLCAVHELGLSHLIGVEAKWNQPARRHLTDPNNWYTQVVNDNPGAHIVHYSGLKLTHLMRQDDGQVLGYRGATNGIQLLCVGLERAGMASVTALLAAACSEYGYIQHRPLPTLGPEASMAIGQANPETADLVYKRQIYARQDAAFIMDTNHHLAPLMPYLDGDSVRFLVLLRDPIELVQSRIRAGRHWPTYAHALPVFYQQYLLDCEYDREPINLHRLQPAHAIDMGVLELHLWEIYHNLTSICNYLEQLDKSRYFVISLDKLPLKYHELIQFAGLTHIPSLPHLGNSSDVPAEVSNWAWAMSYGNAGKIHNYLDKVWERALRLC